MKTRIYFLLGLLFFTEAYFAQAPQTVNFCGSYDPVAAALAPAPYSPNPNGMFTMRIFVYIVRNSAGSNGQTIANVNSALAIMANDYATHNICFSLMGMGEIHDDFVNGLKISEFHNWASNVNNIYNKPNAITIYLFDDNSDMDGLGNGAGNATGIPGKAFAVGGKIDGTPMVTSSTISHEMGHCLGLFHTHEPYNLCDPTCQATCDQNIQCHCQDSVCDTPPDPTLNFGTNVDILCNYMPNLPANPLYLAVDTRNIMSYSRITCLNHFTAGQGNRMRITLNETALLQTFIVPDFLTISNTVFTAGQNKLYDVKYDITTTNITVNSSANLYLRAGNQIWIQPDANILAGSSFHAQINHQCNDFSNFNSARLVHEVAKQSPAPEVFTEFKIVPNPSSGLFKLRTETLSGYPQRITIRDMQGKVVLELENPQQYEYNFDLKNCNRGIYMISVYYSSEVKSKKLIID